MTTDINTGLPTLPEGYFWRVNRETVEIRKSLPDTDWIEKDLYSFPYLNEYSRDGGKKEIREVELKRNRDKVVRKWFRKVTITEQLIDVITQYRYVGGTEKVVEAQTDKNGETTLILGRYYSAEYTIIEHRAPVTKENIQSVCERALEKFEALELLGDYPPKKLES